MFETEYSLVRKFMFFLMAVSLLTGFFYYQYGISGALYSIALLCTFFLTDVFTIAVSAFAIIASSIPIMYNGFGDGNYTISHHLIVISEYLILTFIILYIKRIIKETGTKRKYYTSLFEHATEAILLVNNRGKIVLVNPATLKMFGYGEDELNGEAIETLIPNRFRSSHTSYVHGYYKRPESRQMGAGRDLFAVKKGGKEFPVEVSLSYFEENGTRFAVAFVVDITRRKEIENRIIQQSEELERKVEERTIVLKEALSKLEFSQLELKEALEKEKELNDIKSRFVSMASHEFRTPLSTVLSSAELIEKYTKSEEQDKRNRHIIKIQNAVHHLNDILEDFLSLGKLDEGRITAECCTLNLKNLLASVKEELDPIRKKGQHIEYSFSGTEDIISDKKMLRNILINLLSNAIKYSDENKPIYLSASVDNDIVTIKVRDEGIGIADADQQYLFSTFFRGRNASNIQGTGLGLHIVKRYVDLLDGNIKLESSLNYGTTVTITLNADVSIAANE